MFDLEFLTTVLHHLRYELLFSALFGLLLVLSPDAWAKVTGEHKPKKAKQETPKEAPQDAAALAAHITELSATRYGKAIDMYLANEERLCGLGAELAPCIQALGVASVRVGRADRLPSLFKGLQGRSEAGGVLVHCLRVLASKQQYQQALEALDEWRNLVTKDLAQVPCLALSCAVQASVELRKVDEAERFFRTLAASKEATARDFAAMIRLYAALQMPDQAKQTLDDMQKNGLQPDNVAYNMVLAVCSGQEGADCSAMLNQMQDKDIVTYNTRLKACAKSKDVTKAFALFDEITKQKIAPTQVTFGSLLEVCTRAGDLQKGRSVLKMMDAAKVPKNAIVYTSMIRGLAQQGQLKEAMEVFGEMKRSVAPDIICYSVLIKAHCDQSQLEPAIQLLEDLLEHGHAPDEILFNSLLAGCAQQPHVQLGEKLLRDMVSHRIQPTMATFSIMLKMYSKASCFQQSAQLLEAMPVKYGVVPAVRLYVQHVSWCIRLRRGASALQVYKLLMSRCPDCVDMDQFLTACQSFNMLDTAVQLLEVAPVKFSPAAVRDLVEVVKRKKPALAAKAEAAAKAH